MVKKSSGKLKILNEPKGPEDDFTVLERVASLDPGLLRKRDRERLVDIFLQEIALPMESRAVESKVPAPLYHPGFWQHADNASALIERLEDPLNWSTFWCWATETITIYVQTPQTSDNLYEIIQTIDLLTCLVFIEAGHLWPCVTRDTFILHAFTRLWLAELECQEPMALLPLVKTCGPTRFVAAISRSVEEVAQVFFCRIHALHTRFLQNGEDPGFGILDIMDSVTQEMSSLPFQLALHGMTPMFVKLAGDLMKHAVDDITHGRELAVPKTGQRVLQLTFYLLFPLSFGPSYIIQAIDSGIIHVALSTSIFWKYRRTYSFDGLKQLGDNISSFLKQLQQHFCHVQVWRHTKRMQERYRDEKYPLPLNPDHIRAAPFQKQWENWNRREIEAAYLYDRYMGLTSIMPSPCDNPRCPRKPGHRIKLKECSRCDGGLRVCSKRCQRIMWPEHRPGCELVARAGKDDPTIMQPAILITQEAILYFQYLIQHFAVQGGCRSLYQNHRSQLQCSPVTKRPTHVIRVEYNFDRRPIQLQVEPLSKHAGFKHMMKLDDCLKEIQTRPRCALFCAEFVNGNLPLLLFSLGEVTAR